MAFAVVGQDRAARIKPRVKGDGRKKAATRIRIMTAGIARRISAKPHQEVVRHTAEPGANESDDNADHQSRYPGQQTEGHRVPDPVKKFGEDVHAAVVDSQPVFGGGRTERPEAHVMRIVHGQPWTGQHHEREKQGQPCAGHKPGIGCEFSSQRQDACFTRGSIQP